MGKKKRAPAEQRSHSAAARRRKKNERKYAFTCGVVLVLLLSIGVALSLTVFFPIKTITVSGNTHYAEGDVIEASGLAVDRNIFCFSAASAQDKLVERFPYIERAKISRALPDAITIEITEAKIETVIEIESGFLPLSRHGRVLEAPAAFPPEGMPRVIGFSLTEIPKPGAHLPETEQERFDLLRQIESGIKQLELSPIRVIDLRDPIEMRLLYDGRISIELGSKIDLEYKLRAAAEVIKISCNSTTVGTLDVSVRPTMRLRELNLYAPENWPFPESMRTDYERAIPKRKPIVPTPPKPSGGNTSSGAPSQDSSSLVPDSNPSPQPPAEETPVDPKEETKPPDEEDQEEDELPPLTVIEA